MKLYPPLNKFTKNSIAFLGFFALLWYFTYPLAFQISDEKAYIEQAIALSQGRIYNEFALAQTLEDYIPKNYPLGTAFLAAPFVYFGGKWAVFLLSPFCYILAIFLSIQTLKKLDMPIQGAYAIGLFLPAIVMSRHVMSEMPSLLLLATFIYVLAQAHTATSKNAFLLGWLGFVGLLFREANILLTLPLLFYWAKEKEWRNSHYLALGALVAVGMRLWSSHVFYGDAFYVKDPGVRFTLQATVANFPYYFIGLMLLLPLGGYYLYRYRAWYRKSIVIALLAYILFHLCYNYRGQGAESGYWGGVLLTLRFFIPCLPIFALLYASAWAKSLSIKIKDKNLMFIGIVLLLGVYSLDFRKGKQQRLHTKEWRAQHINVCSSKIYYEYCSTLYE